MTNYLKGNNRGSIEVEFQYLPGSSDENHEWSQPGYLVVRPVAGRDLNRTHPSMSEKRYRYASQLSLSIAADLMRFHNHILIKGNFTLSVLKSDATWQIPYMRHSKWERSLQIHHTAA
jgi:hypothetical protein